MRAQDALTSQAAAARQAETTSHEAAQRASALDRVSTRLAEETAKTSALRQDLAALTQQQVSSNECSGRFSDEQAPAREPGGETKDARFGTTLRC